MSPQAGAHDARAQRFFFALRPDPQAAAALAGLAVRLAAQVGGRPLAAVDLHLTLAFVGARNAADTARLADMLDGLLPAVQAAQPPCIPFALSQLGAFGAQPIDWVQALSDGLRRRLTEAGVDHDERPLRAHLTLLRGARRATAARGTVAPIAPAGWTLCLGWSGLDSTPQRRYQWHCHDTVKLAS
ncbi:MAG: hypothetical protein ABT05_06235 [Lautropia sp. SCN 66-9]|nr:MAG: hypothetical protein ABT05_06235 [Lautropia sp. SCN 66-9]